MQKKLIDFLAAERGIEWAGIASLAIILVLAAIGNVSYNDFWWHLAVGKWMFQTHSLLQHEIFSYAFQGKLWMNATWIFDGAIYLIYSSAGYLGLGLFRCIIIGGSYVILIAAARSKHKTPYALTTALFLLTLPFLRNFLRPEITSPLFLGCTLYALYSYRYHRSKWIYTLPLVEVIWVNTHGSFQMGIVIAGIFFGAELIRSLIAHRNNLTTVLKDKLLIVYGSITALTAAATLINPLGFRIYDFVFAMLNDKETLANISEWQPFSLQNLLNLSSNFMLPIAVLTLTCCLTLIMRTIAAWKKDRALLPFIEHFFYEDVLILAFFTISLMKYNRIIYLFSLALAFIIVKNASVLFKTPESRRLAGIILLPCALFSVLQLYPNLRMNTGPAEAEQAAESVTFVKEHHLKGRIINEYGDGGELLWQLYPDYQIFIDGRAANVYDASFYWYFRTLGNKYVLDAISKRYNATFAMAPLTSSMYQLFINNKDWQLVFFDNASSVFIRKDSDDASVIPGNSYTLLNPSKDPLSYLDYCAKPDEKQKLLAEIMRNTKELAKPAYSLSVLATLSSQCPGKTVTDLHRAEAAIEQALTYRPYDANLWNTLGTIQVSLGRDQEAIGTFKRSIGLLPSKQNLTGLGVALHNTAKYADADKVFQRVITATGDAPKEYYQIYGRVSYQLDHNEKAIDLFHRYIDSIDPADITAQDYRDLSNAYKDSGDTQLYQEYLQKAQDFKPFIPAKATSTPIG